MPPTKKKTPIKDAAENMVENVWSRVLARLVAPLLITIGLAVGGWMANTVLRVNENVIKLYGWNRLLFYRLNDLDNKGIPEGMKYGDTRLPKIIPEPTNRTAKEDRLTPPIPPVAAR